MKFRIFTVLSAILAGAAPGAADTEWTNAGPDLGRIAFVRFDPRDPSIAYAGTGAGLFKSKDGAASWQNTGLSGWSIGSLLIDPQNTNTLYAQAVFSPDEDTDISKVFQSTDGGATWSDLVSDARLLAIDPQDGRTLYVLAGGSPPDLFKSTDAGAGWTRLSGLPARLHIVNLVVDPQNRATLYATVEGQDSTGRPVATVYKSRDGGASWSESASGLPGTFFLGNGAPGNPLPFASSALTIDPSNPNTIYLTRAVTGVYKSTDGGTSWRAANLGMPRDPQEFPPCCGVGVLIDPRNSNVLYTTAVPVGNIIFKSQNGGLSWQMETARGLLPFQNTLAIDPQNTGTLFAATAFGVFRSTDGGANFDKAASPRAMPVASLAIDPQGTVYASGGYGPFKSADGGTNWTPANAGIKQGYGVVSMAFDPRTPANVYAATSPYECGSRETIGIFKSTDGGLDWSDVGAGIGCLSAIAVDPQNPGTVYAGTQYNGVVRSTDGGATWGGVNAGLPRGRVGALAVDPRNPGTLYVGLLSGAVFKSTNGGASWDGAGLAAVVNALAIDPQDTSTVYAAAANGLWKSTDAGASWRNLFAYAPIAVYAVAIDPQTTATIYAALQTGVVQSTDGGESWIFLTGGADHVRLLALDPRDSSTLYAGGQGGLFTIRVGEEAR